MFVRRCVKVGVAVFALGLVVIVTAGVSTMSPRHTDMTTVLGAVFALTGALTAAVAYAVHSNQATRRPTAQVWSEGHETGFSEGWRECAREHIGKVEDIGGRRKRLAENV